MKNSEKVVVVTRINPEIAEKLDRIIDASPIKTNRTKLIEKLICMHVAANPVEVDEAVDPEPEIKVESTPPPQPASVPAMMMVEEDVDDSELDSVVTDTVEFVDDADDDFDSDPYEDDEEVKELSF